MSFSVERLNVHCTICVKIDMALLMFGRVRTARGLHERMPRTFWNAHSMFLSVPGEWHWMGMYRAVVLCSSSCILSGDMACAGMAPNAARCTDTAPNRFPPCGSWLLRSFSNQYGCREKTTVNYSSRNCFQKRRDSTHTINERNQSTNILKIAI